MKIFGVEEMRFRHFQECAEKWQDTSHTWQCNCTDRDSALQLHFTRSLTARASQFICSTWPVDFKLSIFNIRFLCSKHKMVLGVQWIHPRFLISSLWCQEKRIQISSWHSLCSQSSASLHSVTPNWHCELMYLRFSRSDLCTVLSAFQKESESILVLNCQTNVRF